jgi:gamma-glutamyltranspeptidase/glutathione hydrolase
VAGGKRPLSSMSPTIVLKDGDPILTLGAAGGPTIISQVVLTIVRHLDLGMDLSAAVAAPRIHHQWRPDKLRVEESFDKALSGQLQEMGHQIEAQEPFGATQAIAAEGDGKTLIGLSDPRTAGKAAGP